MAGKYPSYPEGSSIHCSAWRRCRTARGTHWIVLCKTFSPMVKVNFLFFFSPQTWSAMPWTHPNSLYLPRSSPLGGVRSGTTGFCTSRQPLHLSGPPKAALILSKIQCLYFSSDPNNKQNFSKKLRKILILVDFSACFMVIIYFHFNRAY